MTGRRKQPCLSRSRQRMNAGRRHPMSGFMNPAEFANIRRPRENFWWYRGMRAILFRMLEPHLAGRKIGRALEAGCGTGYFSHLLAARARVADRAAGYQRRRPALRARTGSGEPVQGDIRSPAVRRRCVRPGAVAGRAARTCRAGEEQRGGARIGAGCAARRAGGGAHVGAGHSAQPALANSPSNASASRGAA